MSILSQQKQSVNTDFPNLRPSLDLRFALAKKLDPRITFTRGSTGTYFGSDGIMRTAGVNEPRFDHDPVTGQSLGLLIEESRQNLLLYSNDFSNAAWISSGLLYSYNDTIGLDGITSASTVTANIRTTALNALYQNFTCSASTTYTFSFYVRLGTLPASSFKIAVYNNTGATFIAVDVRPTQTLSSSSWTRVSYTFTTPAGCVSARVYPYRNNSFTQNNGTFYLWGAQLETGAFPTSYIPTGASTVTRSADNASMEGTNFSSWYNQNEGTIFADLRNYSSSTLANFGISIGSATNNYFAFPYISGSGVLANGVFWRQPELLKSLDFPDGGAGGKYAISYKNGQSFSGYLNGSLGIVQSPPYPNPTGYNSLYIGRSHFAPTRYQNFYIRRFTYYPIQITNQQLINLTS